MTAWIWRLLLAAILFVVLFAALPLFLQVIGVPVSGPLLGLIRICAGALAVLYVFFGRPIPPPA